KRTTAPRASEPAKVLDKATILELQALVPRVPVADHVVRYAVDLVRATRPSDPSCPDELAPLVEFGAGPRASQSLVLAAKARAALHGRFAAEIDDVMAVARPVLRHRVLPSFLARAEGRNVESILSRLF